MVPGIIASANQCNPYHFSLASWYIADSLSLNDGDSVTSWLDSGPNGNNLTVSASAPTFKKNIVKGHSIVRFDGTNNTLVSPTAIGGIYPLTVFVVMATSDTTHISDVVSVLSPGGDNFNCLVLGEYTPKRWHNGSSFFGRTPNTVSSIDETSNNTFLLMRWKIADNDFSIHRNGVQLSQTSSYTWAPSGDTIWCVGRRGLVSDGVLLGDIAEIIGIHGNLDDTTSAEIESYLTNKYL